MSCAPYRLLPSKTLIQVIKCFSNLTILSLEWEIQKTSTLIPILENVPGCTLYKDCGEKYRSDNYTLITELASK